MCVCAIAEKGSRALVSTERGSDKEEIICSSRVRSGSVKRSVHWHDKYAAV